MLHIFMRRCLTIGLEYNYVTEFNYDEAFELAKKCDALRESNPE